uniref:Uncharacterized protein n=1 Tax=Candidatus Kentrum sp. SD TaxID=2126332 RepID=A0A450Y533_9GAMM|nr:MAG: hypothetical protein BECKSD772F_GA0070984_100359 [Candidatus Kentron sp. SD]VFK39561.1 MAG: hypothetical protein BECKSD772E_GA0070983_100315 [Candidatus Kentron sp. SD]
MRIFPKTIITMIMIFGSNPIYGFLSCPQTERHYQTLLSQQGGSITSLQNQALQKQCYEELKFRFEQEIQNWHQKNQPQSFGRAPMEIPGTGSQLCSDGLFRGKTVHPNRCLIGQGAEMMEKMFGTFGFN